MNEGHSKNLADWAFPLVENTFLNEGESTSLETNKDDEIEKEKQKLIKEFNQLKFEYENKIETLNTLLNELKDPIDIINDEMMEILENIIKKSVKALIFKEIHTDPTLIKSIILELKKIIKDKNGMLHICVSEIDYQRLDSETISPETSLSIDTSLREGDVIIRSKSTEIRAVLDERLEQIIRMQHD